MGAIEALLAGWRNNPTRDATIALCAEVSRAGREDWLREVAASAETWHHADPLVMRAVGRMYLDVGLFGDAESALISAGRADATSHETARLLGEALLRRGDALRAQQAFARALELGGAPAEVTPLNERAAGLVALQRRAGVDRVAQEVARVLPLRAGLTNPKNAPFGAAVKRSPSRPPGAPNGGDVPLPRFDLADPVEVSEVYALSVQGSPAAPAARAAGSQGQVLGMLGKSRGAPPPRRNLAAPTPEEPALTPLVANPTAAFDSAVDVSDMVYDSDSRPSFDDITTGVKNGAARGLPFAAQAPRAMSPATSQGIHEFVDSAEPSPSILLQHLARVGVFEPGGGAAPAWEKPAREKARGIIPLLILIVLTSAGGSGAYHYTMRLKAERAAQAVDLTTEVAKLLHSGRPKDLQVSDEKLSKVFDLDSRSQRAGRQWLENRVLGALLLDSEPRGLDSAVHRGREVGLRERELAVGRVASFFVEGDLAGAAALLPKWDGEAANDALYQLTAGAVLERAGDARAIERYDAARTLDSKLVPADLLLARLLLLEYGVARARPVLDELSKKVGPDDANWRALSALAWVVSAERPAEVPESARLSADDTARLIAPLRAVPAMVEAVVQLGKRDLAATSKAIESALPAATGPAIAATLGFLAIDSGNDVLARKAALKALSFAALYPRARTLAARVALLGGRLEEAQKAIEELDPKSPDVAIVRSVVAYETGDAAELANSLHALDVGDPAFAGLFVGPNVLGAARYPDSAKLESMAVPSVPWGDIIAADAALDTGNLALAEKVLASRAESTASAHQLRVARLRRYQKNTAAALTASAAALSDKPTVALLVERTLELLEAEKPGDARDLLARYPTLLGPVGQWLGVLVDVAANQPKQAAARLALLEPPPEETPAYLRVLAARALVAANDKRARIYLPPLVRRMSKHPDVLATAALLNAK